MVNQTVQAFNAAHFKRWEVFIYIALDALHTGLNKITFEEPYSQKIINNLYNSISQIQQARTERDIEKRKKLLLRESISIQNALNDIVYNKKMSQLDAEIYFFESAKLFNYLLREAFTQSFDEKNTIEEKIKIFSTKTFKLPQNISVTSISEINKPLKHSSFLLKNTLESAPIEENKQEKIITCAAEAVAWFEQKVYQLAFDHFYIHSVQLHKIIRNITAMSSSQEKQAQSFNDLGLEALNTSASQDYLNKIASDLGFVNLQNLYDNFHKLDTQKEFETYCKKKKNFFENESMSVAIKTITEEFNRINTISDSSPNSSYRFIITALGERYLAGIEACQHAKNLVLDFAETYFNEKSDKATKKHDVQLKNSIYEKFLFILLNESIFEEKIINVLTHQLSNEWLELRKKQTEAERIEYSDILERIKSSSEEFILEHYLSSEEVRSEAFVNYKNALKKDPGHEPIDEKRELDLASKKYRNYKHAVQYSILQKVLNEKEIENFVEKQIIKISTVNEKIKSLRDEIASKNKTLVELNTKEKSILGLLKNLKTSQLREKKITVNEIQKNIFSLKRECELAEWEFTFYHLAQKIIDEQLNTYSLLKDLPISSLRREITQRLNEYIEIHKKIIACYLQSNPNEDIGDMLHSLEIEYIKTKEIARFTCNLLIEKLTKTPNGIMELADENVFELEKTFQTLCEQKIKVSCFEEEKSLLDAIEALPPLLSAAVEKALTKLEQDKLPEYLEKISNHLKNRDHSALEDPFEFLLKKIVQKNINSFSKLNEIFLRGH